MEKIRSLIAACTLIVFIVVGCTEREPTYGDRLAKELQQKGYKNFDTTSYYSVVQSELKSQKSVLRNPLWVAKLADSTRGLTLLSGHFFNGDIDTLLNYINGATAHGIRPSVYHYEQISETIEALRTLKVDKASEAYSLLARLDILSTDALIAYADDLRHGVVNPKRLYGRYFVPYKRFGYNTASGILDSLDMPAYLRRVQPDNRYYRKLQALLISGTLNSSQRTGVLMSMEKLRWMGVDFPEKYVQVNIPEQRLYVTEDDKPVLTMNVCVGETAYAPYARKGENHETPVMSGVLNAMQVNPVWNIPRSIALKEILSSVRNDPNYLASRNMVAIYKGKQVDPNAVDWHADSVEKFRFKQNPGSDNSLGNIKFLFDNPYSIYLHDTPAKQLFSASNRAVSHGCVRVQNPVGFAAYLVNDEKQAERIATEINTDSITESRWVTLKRKMPVFLTYYTTWLRDGKVESYADIYGYDERLRNALKKYIN